MQSWGHFQQDWNRFLSRRRISALHTSEFMSKSRSDYRGVAFTREAKIDVLGEAMQIANVNVLAAVGFAVDCDAFRKMSFIGRKKCFDDAHKLCFHELIKNVVHGLEQLDQKEGLSKVHPIALTFDDNVEYAMKCYQLLEGVKQRKPLWKSRLGSICFSDDELYKPIQIADVFAWLSSQKLKGPSDDDINLSIPEIDGLFKLGLNGRVLLQGWYDEGALQELDQKLQPTPEEGV